MKFVPLEHSSMKPWTECEGPVSLGALQEKGAVSALSSSQVKEKIKQKEKEVPQYSLS